MMKLTILLVLVALPTGALAQSQRTFYGVDGRVTGRSNTDSAGATTFYGVDGRVRGRMSTGSTGTTTIYDAGGRNVGSVTTSKPHRSK